MLRPSVLGLTAFLWLLSGCGSPLYLAMKGTPPRPPAEVLDCVKGQLVVLGYTLASLDVEEHRVTARKYDWETRVADTQFRRMVDRVSAEARPAEGGARLKIEAHTFAELATYRGPTEIERSASPAVREAAQKVLEACGS